MERRAPRLSRSVVAGREARLSTYNEPRTTND